MNLPLRTSASATSTQTTPNPARRLRRAILLAVPPTFAAFSWDRRLRSHEAAPGMTVAAEVGER